MYTCVKRIMKQQNLFCFCLNDAQSTQNHTSYSTLLQVTTLIPQNSTSTCFSVPSPVMKNIIVVKASIRCVQGCKSVFLCTCERWGSSHSATSTHTRWLSKLKKKKMLSGTLLHSTSWAQTNGPKSHSGGRSGRLWGWVGARAEKDP